MIMFIRMMMLCLIWFNTVYTGIDDYNVIPC